MCLGGFHNFPLSYRVKISPIVVVDMNGAVVSSMNTSRCQLKSIVSLLLLLIVVFSLFCFSMLVFESGRL